MKDKIKTLEEHLVLLENSTLLKIAAGISLSKCLDILPYLDNDVFDKYYVRFKKMQQKYND